MREGKRLSRDTYVGETERTAQARFKEHTSTAVNAQGKFKSAMLQHARDNEHHFRKEDISILSRESDWVRRGIKEAIYIKALNPSNGGPPLISIQDVTPFQPILTQY